MKKNKYFVKVLGYNLDWFSVKCCQNDLDACYKGLKIFFRENMTFFEDYCLYKIQIKKIGFTIVRNFTFKVHREFIIEEVK